MRTKLVVVVLAVLATAGEARADRRAFTHTYEYATQPQGNLELEFYNTQESATYATDSPTGIRSEVEVEYGITDHWDIALYQIWEGGEAAGANGFGYHETKLESRYRLAERGEWPIDVVGYLEVFKPFGVKGVGLEPKIILARDFGPVTVAGNLALELEPSENASNEVEYEADPEYAVGATWEIIPEWKVGAESWGSFEAFEDSTTGDYAAYVGPAIGWAPSARLWTAATAGFRLKGQPESSKFAFTIAIGLSI